MSYYQPQSMFHSGSNVCPLGHSNCLLHYENEQLCNFLMEEKIRNQELSSKINLFSREIDKLSLDFENKASEYNELINRYRQSEHICQEQSKLIEALQSEIDNMRKTNLEERNPFLKNHQNSVQLSSDVNQKAINNNQDDKIFIKNKKKMSAVKPLFKKSK